MSRISTHAPLAGRDVTTGSCASSTAFQPTRPLRGATCEVYGVRWLALFQPTRPLRGATGLDRVTPTPHRDFNPRAPCGARPISPSAEYSASAISTHAPLAGRDQRLCGSLPARSGFQPTRPLRGATFISITIAKTPTFQPTRPLRGATRITEKEPRGKEFQPTRPLRGATFYLPYKQQGFHHFNPRAPCGARPMFERYGVEIEEYFNPRAPCGARPCQQ